MNFTKVIEALIEDKKVRRKSWDENKYWHMDNRDGVLSWNMQHGISSVAHVRKSQFEADDWEIYGETKLEKLKKIVCNYCDNQGCCLKDVKCNQIEALLEFFEK